MDHEHVELRFRLAADSDSDSDSDSDNSDSDWDAAVERLVDAGFLNFAIEDGVLTAWLAAAEDPQEIERLVGTTATRRTLDHAALYDGVVPFGSWEVAPGWWVVSGDGVAPTTAAAARVVVMPNGGGFGDGRHPATCLAAGLLLGLDLRGLRVLDVGCGTGLLGILAAKAGAAAVTLADIDADSVLHARACVAANGVTCTVLRSDLLADLPAQTWDVLAANLYAEFTVVMLADPRLAQLLPRGWLVLSGISDGKRGLVEDALATNGFVVRGRRTDDGWCGLLAQRKG